MKDQPVLSKDMAQRLRELVLSGHGPAMLRLIGGVAAAQLAAEPGSPEWPLSLEAQGVQGTLNRQAAQHNVWDAVMGGPK